jgi:AmpD protein
LHCVLFALTIATQHKQRGQQLQKPLTTSACIDKTDQLDITTLVQRPCSHFDDRPKANDISLLVVHNISLPPRQYNTTYIDDFFAGTLNCDAHPYFAKLKGVRVSAHCVIFRDGRIWQYVPFAKRAWHAGVSQFLGREKCNDFSIGIELEGCDDEAFADVQYVSLAALCKQLMLLYPAILPAHIVGHSDIAPGRKTDPGPYFDWARLFALLDLPLLNRTSLNQTSIKQTSQGNSFEQQTQNKENK